MGVSYLVKNAVLIAGMLMLVVSSSTYAEALGQPQRTSMVGYAIGAALVSVDDPAGGTEASSTPQPITLVYTARVWRSSLRYWSELYYYKTLLDASSTKIGQDVERYGMRLSLQKNLKIMPKFSAWFGAGLDISQEKFTTRTRLTAMVS